MGELDFYHVDELPPREAPPPDALLRRVRAATALPERRDKIHLSKNPIFSGRVESLIETFPDARIVVCLRDPDETIPSLLEAHADRLGAPALGRRRAMQRSLRVLAEQSFHTYRYPLEVLRRHPETPHAIVDYRDLVRDPAAVVHRVYERLGFPRSAELDRALALQERRSGAARVEAPLQPRGVRPRSRRDSRRARRPLRRFNWDVEERQGIGT